MVSNIIKVSKWLSVEAAYTGKGQITSDDTLLASLLNENYKVEWRYNPINLEEIKEITPSSQFENCTVVNFKNNTETIIKMPVTHVYEILLSREDYVEKSSNKLVTDFLRTARSNQFPLE